MKISNFYPIVLISLMILFFSCKKEQKKIDEPTFTIENNDINIQWTAYKTNQKIPVKGTFNEVELYDVTPAANPSEVIRNLKFSIPVKSIYSKDSIRDFKLREFLFGAMNNTNNIEGKISLDNEGKGNASLTMNGFTKEIPVSYNVHGENIKIDANIDLNNWQAQAALTALNDVCSEKHKGDDGISKTWSEVDIHIEVITTSKK
ncbi:MAG: YceI family protein [Bacteroidota bacterium]